MNRIREGIITTSDETNDLLEVFSLLDKQVSESEDQEENIFNSTIKLEGKLELKPLPSNLKYAFLGASDTYPVVISSELSKEQEVRLVSMLGKHKKAFG